MNILPYLQGKGKHKHFIILFYTYHVGIKCEVFKKYTSMAHFQSENKKHAIGIANMNTWNVKHPFKKFNQI